MKQCCLMWQQKALLVKHSPLYDGTKSHSQIYLSWNSTVRSQKARRLLSVLGHQKHQKLRKVWHQHLHLRRHCPCPIPKKLVQKRPWKLQGNRHQKRLSAKRQPLIKLRVRTKTWLILRNKNPKRLLVKLQHQRELRVRIKI